MRPLLEAGLILYRTEYGQAVDALNLGAPALRLALAHQLDVPHRAGAVVEEQLDALGAVLARRGLEGLAQPQDLAGRQAATWRRFARLPVQPVS